MDLFSSGWVSVYRLWKIFGIFPSLLTKNKVLSLFVFVPLIKEWFSFSHPPLPCCSPVTLFLFGLSRIRFVAMNQGCVLVDNVDFGRKFFIFAFRTNNINKVNNFSDLFYQFFFFFRHQMMIGNVGMWKNGKFFSKVNSIKKNLFRLPHWKIRNRKNYATSRSSSKRCQ